MKNYHNLFGNIAKTEDQDDGTVKVWGYASSNNIDSDGETITSEAMNSAIPDYMKFGAVRSMHGNNAAGTALEIEVQSDGKTFFGAHIVDPVDVLKVKTGTYKGFSIGGKVLKRDDEDSSIITSIKLVEISLVDRPANPEAVFTMYKSEQVDKDIENSHNKEKGIKMSENIEKSLSNVAWLANLLQELSCLQSCMQSETDFERDGSKLPEELTNVIKELSVIFVASAKEESDELTSNVTSDIINEVNTEDMAYSDKPKDLKKSGSRNSSSDLEMIQKIHDLALNLGAMAKSDKEDDKETMESDEEEEDENDKEKESEKSNKVKDLKKFDNLNEELSKAKKINDDLVKRVKELEALPKPQKAVTMTVSKTEDLGVKTSTEVIVKNHAGEIDLIATAIKKSQQSGNIIKF